MKRLALIGFAVVLVAVAIGLFVLVRAPARPTAVSAVPAKLPAAASEPPPRSAAAGSRPGLPVDGPAVEPMAEQAAPDRPPARTYVRDDGAVVVDRRRNPGPPELTGAISRPPSLSLFESSAVVGVHRILSPEIRKCAKKLASDSGEPLGRVRADVMVSSAGGVLAIDSLTLKAGPSIAAEQLAEIASCASSTAIGRSLAVEGQKDLTGEFISINLPIY